MAFRLGQISYPNLTTDYSGELNAAAQLGKTVAGLPEQWRKQAEEERTKALLGEAMKTGDYSKAGMALLGAGKIEQGAALVGLGQKQQTLEGQKAIGTLLGGGAPSSFGVPSAPVAPTAAPGLGAVSNSTGSSAPRPFDRPVQVAETEADVQRLEADMERRSQIGYGNPALPAGMRNNNPGNIKYVRPGQAAGVLGPSQNTDQGDPQAVFNSPEAGMRAAYELAMRKYQGGKRTALDLIAGENGWTPGNTAAAANIARGMGVAPNEDLRLDDPQRAQAFIGALISQEHGRAGSSYPREMIAGAVTGQPAAGTQVASAPAPSAAGPDGVYGNTPTEQLQGFINNPRVPENLRGLMQQELARRGGGQPTAQPAPVQMAQAEPQPGAPVADMPAAGANAAQFAVPGSMLPPNDPLPQVPNQALMGIIANPAAADGQRALAQSVLANRQKYSDENAPDIREQKRLQTEKARLEVEKAQRDASGVLSPEQEAQKIRIARAGRPVNEPALPPGYKAIRDAEGNIERLEPIPGSKQEREATDLAEKKVKADRIKGEVGTTVGNALDDIDRLMKSATLPTSGALGSRLASIPGTAAHDVAQALTTVGANISFSQLQQMREASPTGGALGAVSDNEQKLLQNSYAALSQSQTTEQFKTNLGRVRATFERIVHGRQLTPQERRTGGPMTMERAKGLRDEAAAAIASGAPKDAVMKRLKEDYGISPEGL